MASSTTVSSIAPNVTTVINDTNSKVTDNSKEWSAETTPRIAFLAFFILFGFIGNLFLIITICHSQRFRAITFYVFIINQAVVNLCECVFNISILLVSSTLNEWTFGDICCSLSAFFLSFVSVETVLGLMTLTVDRLVAVRYKDKYDYVVSAPRITVFIVFTWCQSFCFSIPIAVDAIPTSVNNYTKSCVVARNASIVFGLCSVILCFIVPLVLMIVMFVKIIRTGYRERVMIRTLISQHSYKDDVQQEPRIKQDIRHSNLTGTVCFTWLCIQGPYLVTYYFNQLKNSAELEPVDTHSIDYAWYVDLVLLCLRFSFVLVLPIATFMWNKDLWKSFKDLILCRKNNSIEDESFKKNDSDSLRIEKKIKDEEKVKEKTKETIVQTPREQRVFQVPVLFATSHGVHIQTSSQTNIFENEGSDGQTAALRGKKCDVIGSRENLNLEEDTSDYDSANEMDPFSMSSPVSVKHLQSSGLTDRQRSVSNPEVRENLKTDEKTLIEAVGSTSVGDSGLDLSSGTILHNGHTTKSGEQDVLKKTETDSSPVLKTDAFEVIKENDDNHFKSKDNNTKMSNVEMNENNSVLENASINNKAEHSHDLSGENNEEPTDKSVEKVFTLKKKKSLNSGSKDSPAQRRKKKKLKDKNLDNLSNASDLSCTTLPLRPPPRLAPISASTGLKRPGSSCSSQCSFVENYSDCAQCVHVSSLSQDRCIECAKNDTASCDNLSISSFNLYRNLGNTHSVLKQTGAFDNQLDRKEDEMKRVIKSVPEETITGSEVETLKRETQVSKPDKTNTCNGAINDAYERLSESESTPEHKQLKVRNSEARRKRRERLSTNCVLNEGKGYTRLLPETP